MKEKPTFDEYILKSEEFAQPILIYLRELIHRTCPAIQEQIKWNFPCFVYKGSNIAYMAGFKQHATFGFGLAQHMTDSQKVFIQGEKTGMGNFGKLTTIQELPSEEIIIEYLHEAMLLHDQGVKQGPRIIKTITKLEVPSTFKTALEQENISAQFESFSTSQRNDYVEWISEAKTETTRDKRIIQAIKWISEGKPRNWKYMKSWKGKS